MNRRQILKKSTVAATTLGVGLIAGCASSPGLEIVELHRDLQDNYGVVLHVKVTNNERFEATAILNGRMVSQGYMGGEWNATPINISVPGNSTETYTLEFPVQLYYGFAVGPEWEFYAWFEQLKFKNTANIR